MKRLFLFLLAILATVPFVETSAQFPPSEDDGFLASSMFSHIYNLTPKDQYYETTQLFSTSPTNVFVDDLEFILKLRYSYAVSTQTEIQVRFYIDDPSSPYYYTPINNIGTNLSIPAETSIGDTLNLKFEFPENEPVFSTYVLNDHDVRYEIYHPSSETLMFVGRYVSKPHEDFNNGYSVAGVLFGDDNYGIGFGPDIYNELNEDGLLYDSEKPLYASSSGGYIPLHVRLPEWSDYDEIIRIYNESTHDVLDLTIMELIQPQFNTTFGEYVNFNNIDPSYLTNFPLMIPVSGWANGVYSFKILSNDESVTHARSELHMVGSGSRPFTLEYTQEVYAQSGQTNVKYTVDNNNIFFIFDKHEFYDSTEYLELHSGPPFQQTIYFQYDNPHSYILNSTNEHTGVVYIESNRTGDLSIGIPYQAFNYQVYDSYIVAEYEAGEEPIEDRLNNFLIYWGLSDTQSRSLIVAVIILLVVLILVPMKPSAFIIATVVILLLLAGALIIGVSTPLLILVLISGLTAIVYALKREGD